MINEVGHFDDIVGNLIEGWAVNPNHDDAPAHVDILVDRRIIGSAVADVFRDDLQKVGIRDGYAAFSFSIPLIFYDGKEHRIDVVLPDVAQPVHNSPRYFTGLPGDIRLVAERRAWAERSLVIRRAARDDDLAASLAAKRRVAIFSTYHSEPTFLAYQRNLFEALTAEGFVVLVVHAGSSLGPGLDAIDRDDCHLIIKRNVGYDFGS